jgi:hypothetical protein
MRGHKALWITGVACFVSGVLLTWFGGYLFLRPVFRMFQEGSFRAAAAEARLDISLLEKLRAGDTGRVIDALEGHLDSRLVTLSVYEDVVPAANRDKYVYESLNRVVSYRRANPRPAQGDPDMADVEASIAKALRMGGSDSGGKHAP